MSSQAAAAAASYKARKEAFVSNLSGSTLTDINLVTLVASSAVLLWSVLKQRGLSSGNTIVNYVVDFLLNVCGILFAFTIYSSVPVLLNLLLIIPGAILGLSAALQPPKKRSLRPRTSVDIHGTDENGDTIEVSPQSIKRKPGRSRKSVPAGNPTHTVQQVNQREQQANPTIQLVNRPFLTNYRGSMLIATVIGILAVDFPIFPRRFAKVETWGISLMDLGVGSFVFSAGVVSARSVLRASTKFVVRRDGRKDWEITTHNAIFGRLLRSLRHSLPLLVLGIMRLISVKNLDYAEHVTEYGVHWNFFFTLALLPPFVEVADAITGRGVRRKQLIYTFIALVIATTYEAVLDNTSLLSFILISPRTPSSSLLAKNREGVFSFIGYLSIFLLGRALGMRLCRYVPPSSPKFRAAGRDNQPISPFLISIEKTTDLHWLLGSTSVLFWLLYWTVTNPYVFNFGLIVSRRLANLPYVLWIAAFNHSQLLLFEILEGFGPDFWYRVVVKDTSGAENDEGGEKRNGPEVATSQIMRSFNKNGLAVFLVANLLTGLVNLSVNTLDMPALQAMGVLIAYAAAVTAVAVGLDLGGLQIKL